MNESPSKKNNGPRERLLKSASKLFYQKGYQASGINQLIEEADIAKASFYDHFPDKESLYCAFLDDQGRNWMAALTSRIASGRSAEGKVRAIFKFIEEWMEADNFRGCPFINSASEFPNPRSTVRVSVREAKDKFRRLIESILSEDKPSSRGSKRDLANQIYVLADGAIVASQIYRDTWPIRNAASVAEKLMSS